MSVRVRVICVIVFVMVVVSAANMCMGLFFTRSRLLETVESDMAVVADIADKLVTGKINLLKANASAVAQYLLSAGDEALHAAMENRLKAFEEFLGLTVFDRKGIVDAYGDVITPAACLEGESLQKAFSGVTNISTTRRDQATQKLVIYVSVPMGRRVLSVAVSGRTFSDLMQNFKVWDTGSIFILDAEGIVIANNDDGMVERRENFVEILKNNPDSEAGDLSDVIIRGERGVGRYVFRGVERLCAYTPIAESMAGWTLGVAAPLPESPAAQVQHGLMIAALIFLAFGVLFAILVSGRLAGPFQKIEEQNAHLAALNEAVQSASEAKSRFLANMSHEMRTPLNAVVGLSELMLGTDEARGDVSDNLKKIYNAGMTLLGIVNDILDISKVESGKFELMPAEYDVPSLINDTVTLNIMRIGDKPITFNLRIDETLPYKLFGDELRVRQICNNLLSNAFKYTKKGSVDLFVECEREREREGEGKGGDVWFTMRVTDTGIGIRPEDIEKLFSDYNQVDTRSNRKIEGTGLGLSITKRMVEMMDGTVTVESEYGKGSVFTARIRQGFVTDLPIGKDIAESLKRFRYCDNKRSRNGKLVRVQVPYAKVLVVDDVQTNLDVAKGMMKPYGMRVDCITSGYQAIHRIREAKVLYDAIFMDHMMPEMDGIETTRIIREEIGTEYAKNIPIIALTANAIIGNEKIFLEHGFQAFISKPIDVMQLDAVVRRWLRHDVGSRGPRAEEREGPQEGVAPEEGAPPGEAVALDETVAPKGGFAHLKIDGLDVEKGLDRFGDDEATFLQVLRSYAVNTKPLLEQIRGVTESGLPGYAIIVHGIKGSSRGVCAESIGNRAEALEHAAKAGDMAFVEANNGGFIEAVEKLLDTLRAALSLVDVERPKLQKDVPDEALLEKLAECCENYDMDGIDEVMAELEKFDYTAGATGADLVVWLRERVERMELAEIRDRLLVTAA